MKKQKTTKSVYSLFSQFVQLIPDTIIQEIENLYAIDARIFTVKSHLFSLLYAHLAHALSLNEVCDSLQSHIDYLSTIKGFVAPKLNTFSHANRTRDTRFIEKLYWKLLDYLKSQYSGFGSSSRLKSYQKKFRATIKAIDSSTIPLTLCSMDWAKHRAKKAAAKLHLSLDVVNHIPTCVIVEEASHHDSTRAEGLLVNYSEKEILLADRAYNEYDLYKLLIKKGIYFVFRAKKNMLYEEVEDVSTCLSDELPLTESKIVSDKKIHCTGVKARKDKDAPIELRIVRAIVKVNGIDVEMEFLTNNFTWDPQSVCDLYKARWEIELFFKELKQTLQFKQFFGFNEKAVQWQIWTGLIANLLMAFVKFQSNWKMSFTRLVGLVRNCIWDNRSLDDILSSCGIAGKPPNSKDSPIQLELGQKD